LFAAVDAVFERDEGVNGLTGEFVVDTDDGCFGDSVVFDECGFDFGGGETVAGYVYDVVYAATDPVVAFVVSTCAVAGELEDVSAIRRYLEYSRSSPCTRSGMYPCTADALPRQFLPYLAKAV
jgi:hypothetical protein